ncbi:MAG: hypothetical protein GY733_02930 [bacterium]|nr:hypothetical protein [bacterium]
MFRLFFSVFVASVCSLSTAAQAAEVVDMRLGRHPAYTRVVFELDAPAGYSLEQSIGAGGATELVVTLDASAVDEEKSLRGSLVSVVSLTGVGTRSQARIRIPKSGLRVKEMILGGPPRIVLDVLEPVKPKAAAAPAPKPKVKAPKPKVEAKAPKPQVKAKAAKPAPSKPVAKAASPAPVASINKGVPPPPTRVTTRPAAKPRPAARPKPTPAPAPAKKPAAVPAARPQAKAPAKAPAPQVAKAKPAKMPPPPARKKRTLPPAPAAIPQSSGNSLMTPRNVGGGLALLALLGGGAWFMQRRRGGEELMSEEDFDQDPMSEDNPFASLGDDFGGVTPEAGSEDQTAEVPVAAESIPEADVVDEFATEDADIPIAKTAQAPEEDLFDTSVMEATMADEQDANGGETTEATGDDMEAYGDTIDTSVEPMPPMAGASAGAGDEVMRMLREFEQRVAGLETRLDEVSEAKERLERQVAAQTEELRVQRAAIARTQRALRNLSRPDDESPTEPALRGDPNA